MRRLLLSCVAAVSLAACSNETTAPADDNQPAPPPAPAPAPAQAPEGAVDDWGSPVGGQMDEGGF